MSAERIASRYAKSLLELAIEQNSLDSVKNDISLFNSVAKNKDFSSMLKSPIISAEKKQNVFNAIFDGKVSDLTKAYFKLIINKGRETNLKEIALEFVDQYKKKMHISTVTLTTASPMGESTVNGILAELKKSTNTDQNIELETKVDPSLIGGYILRFDDKLYDESVAHKLTLLKKEFNKNEYIKNL